MPKTASITPNFQDLLKFVAVITMIIDHMGVFFVSHDDFMYSWFRLFGRLAMPIFLFFAGYNYYNIKKREKFRFWFFSERYRNLFAISIGLQSIILICFPDITILNILFSVVISFSLIDLISLIKAPIYILHFISIALLVPTYDLFDYGTIATGFVVLGYTGHSSKDQVFSFFLGFWLLLICFFAANGSKLNYFQIATLFLEIIILFWCFYYGDLKRIYNYKILLISRYLLPIYFWHYVIFAIVARCFY